MWFYKKSHPAASISTLLLLFNMLCFARSSIILNDHPVVDFTGSEYLDNNQNYFLQWNISVAEKTIYFEVVAKTKGFVGFGISPKGGMTGADILIAGVFENGTLYNLDYHGVGNISPELDSHADWVVTDAKESDDDDTTTIRFYRLLNTCDDEDFEITDGTMRLIWALGETDTVAYHKANRGTKSVNFYSQDEHGFDPTQFETLDLVSNTTMPAQHTAYWCTFFKAPVFSQKQHIVAFDAVLNNPEALKHTHHLTVFRCTVPSGEDPESIFDPWVASPGDHCYAPTSSNFPFGYCSLTPVYVWSTGGKRLVFPENMGVPMPEQLNRREYYALEIHYDNPEVTADLTFPTGARIYYTDKVRDIEAGLLSIDQLEPSILIPPKVSDFVVSGHCSRECTQKYFPEEGITIFNNMFHAHLSGRKLKLRHFRNNEELSWPDVDEYYDFNFQQNKPLLESRKVIKGDQLTVECWFDTTTAEDGKAVIGGFSTREEMCKAIVYYYPRTPLLACGSGQDLKEHMKLFGITNYTYSGNSEPGFPPGIEILEPANMAGDYRDSVSTNVNWNSEFLEKYQVAKRYGEQVGRCVYGEEQHQGVVKYPENFEEYVPKNECETSGASRLGYIAQWLLAFAFLVKLL